MKRIKNIALLLLGALVFSCSQEKTASNEFVNITPQELCDVIAKNKDVVFLDVRSAAEFYGTEQPSYHYGKHFKGAINIPIDQLNSRLDELEKFKNRVIVVNCARGARSSRAGTLLEANGFTQVKNLLGGLSRWEHAGADDIPCKDEILIQAQ